MKDKNISYTEAYAELQLLVSELEKGETTVDELSEKVKRAAELIRLCKSKLTATELEVNNILLELGDQV
ncbi:MAG TPA: exodeoxyribonuclease VII small subunit [Bacteroidales bacterium]|nr:exodeoxyribonuclease VII small subunit [Bacteroidales bacterium]